MRCAIWPTNYRDPASKPKSPQDWDVTLRVNGQDVPPSKAQEVGLALGAQAGEKRLSEVLREAGFTSVRRATATDTNMVLEARA